MSDPIDVADGNTPLLALLIYMLMTSPQDLDHATLVLKLSIEIEAIPPEIGDHYTHPSDDSATSTPPELNRPNTKGRNVDQVRIVYLNIQQGSQLYPGCHNHNLCSRL
jgi:hypothetical protein